MNTHITSILPAHWEHDECCGYIAGGKCDCGCEIANHVIEDCSKAIKRANLVFCPSYEDIKLVINEVSTITNGPHSDKLNTGEISKALLALLRGER